MSRTLTVYLLCDGGETAQHYLRNDVVLETHKIQVVPGQDWTLFVRKKDPVYPSWASFFAGHVSREVFGEVTSAAAVLLLRVDGRWFAATFGHSRFLLHDWAIVEGFGLLAALAALGEVSMRSLDKVTLDAVAGQARLQANRDASAVEFGVDTERELLRSVTGTPEDRKLANRVSGRDSLGVSVNVELADLPELLVQLKNLYESNSGVRHPLIDNIREVRSKEDSERLDEELVLRLRSGGLAESWLAPPEILDWSEVRFFSYGLSDRQPRLIDIRWETFFERVERNSLTVRDLKTKRIYCLDDDQNVIKSWLAYKCIYAEMDHNGRTFLLSGGKWYSVASGFVQEIDDYYASIDYLEDFLPQYDDDTEAKYNIRVALQNRNIFSMDRDLIPYGRGRNKVEFCDLVSTNRDIIHVKRYSGSSELSHLFNQAHVSAELTLVDGEFRELVNAKLPTSLRIAGRNDDFAASKYRIVFAIISQSKSRLNIPFFSKVALRSVAKRLAYAFGYQVAVAKVSVDETRTRTKTVTKKKPIPKTK